MRRARALLALLLLVPAALPAQRDRSVVGVQLGFARSRIEGLSLGEDNAFGSRNGAFVGVYFRQRLAPIVWLQPELNFVLKGGRTSFLSDGPDPQRVDLGLEFGYLDVPLMLRVAPRYRRKGLRPVLFAGPSAGFRISCNVTGESSSAVALVSCDSALSAQVRSVEANFAAGGGIELDRAGIAIALEARYVWGLTRLVADDDRVRNRVFALLLALSL